MFGNVTKSRWQRTKKVPLSCQLLARALPRGPPTGLKATVDRKVYLWSCGIPWCRLTSIYFISFFSFFSFFYIHFMIVNLLFIHHLPFILIIWYLSYRVTQSTIINMKKNNNQNYVCYYFFNEKRIWNR